MKRKNFDGSTEIHLIGGRRIKSRSHCGRDNSSDGFGGRVGYDFYLNALLLASRDANDEGRMPAAFIEVQTSPMALDDAARNTES